MSSQENMLPKVSVIIPIYNTEQYLQECLNSVVNQTLKDIEIICVNDGSTDNSLKILEDYAQKDSRIKIINQENKGVSSARNSGIDICTAPYIFFLDSDDWIEPNCLELLYNEAKEKKVTITAGYAKYYQERNFMYCDFNINKHNSIKSLYTFDNENIVSFFFLFLRGKMYNRDFLQENNIKFNPQITMGEDGAFNYECIYKNATFSIILEHIYNYRFRRENSLTSNLNNYDNDISDYDAIEYVINLTDFKKATDYYKILYVNTIIKAQIGSFYVDNLFRKKMKKICKLIDKNIPKTLLLKCKNYEEFKYITNVRYKPFYIKLFKLSSWKRFVKNHIIK